METASTNRVPCLPDNAPFTAEQRAYLNGFFAGLFSSQPAPAVAEQKRATVPPLMSLSVLFASQSGNAEALAKRLAREAGKRGFAATVHDLAKYPVAQLSSENRLLFVASTYGDGEPPDNAKGFWKFLSSTGASKLSLTKFSVCALGDSNYPKFCRFGKDLDARLCALGGQCVHPRMDCDTDYEETFAQWMNAALSALTDSATDGPPRRNAAVYVREEIEEDVAEPAIFDRNHPFPGRLITNRRLSGEGSEKDVRHFEISLAGSDLRYQAGDALGVYPKNCPELVDEILKALSWSGEEPVSGRNGAEVSIREALEQHYEVTKISMPLLQRISERSPDPTLKSLTTSESDTELAKYVAGRHTIDLLLEHPAVALRPAEFVRLLKKLSPRFYSIASSLKTNPDQVHLTISVVRYESCGRSRKGVCSTFLAERSQPGEAVSIFVQSNANFRPPTDPDAPMIMVGPGTGIAPFRAFLQERGATGAKGKNWLFFGDQRIATDFLYQHELTEMQRRGLLTRLDTAFSRDQPEKIYVQHRMRGQAKDLFAWLEDGAHFYVCGDAVRMAKDVEATLHDVVQIAGNRTAEQAAEYINRLKQDKRYLRDIY